MKTYALGLGWAIAIAIAVAPWVPVQAAESAVTVKIIAFNDFHGSLASGSMAAVAGQPAEITGGIDYMAAYVAELESENANHAVVNAGDLVGATPLISSFYHDEPTIEAMNILGLEFSAVGNHEFDAGPGELLRKQHGGCFPTDRHTCLEDHAFPGAAFQYLSANVVYTATGKTLLPPYALKTFQGVRVAFIGVGLKGTPSIETPRGVAGLTFEDEADAVNALVPELHAQGVHAIVVLIHQGGTQAPGAPGTSGINDCAGLLGGANFSPIVDIVSRLSDSVDLIISGHTHKAYNCRLPNSAGRLVPVTEAGYYGRILTDIDLTLDGSGRVTRVTASNLIVSHVAADAPNSPVHPFLASPAVARIRTLVADYAAAVAPLAERPVGTIAVPLTNTPGPGGEQPAGDLIADSELAATAARMGGAAMAFVNEGGVRSPGFDTAKAVYPHEVTYQEAFAVRPFGNSLVTMTLTAADIKDLLEQQFAGCMGQTANRILQLSNGLHVEWSASAAPCRKIVSVSLRAPAATGVLDPIVVQGVVQHPSKTYRITVDNYLASGGDRFDVLSRGTNPLGGPQDIDALVEYLSATYTAPHAPYDPRDPALHIPRLVRLP